MTTRAERTDPRKWRLVAEDGRQTWHYLETDEQEREWPQTDYDKYWQGILKDGPTYPAAKTPLESARNCYRFYQRLQTTDGHWAGEYGGPMFLIPGLCIAMHITKAPWAPGQKIELINYLRARAHPDDGGWGIHIEGVSTCFGTSLNYVALRILGVPADDPTCVKARAYLHKIGGAVGVPAWGKFWLSVLNVYDWAGNNPIPPELWLLPYILPIHPGRMWCHTRMVYLPMSYLYGIRFQAKMDPLIESLREELYVTPYSEINWPKQRNNVAAVDLYTPHTHLMDFLNGILGYYEWMPNGILRKPALEAALQQIRYEDENTKFLDIGPVNKVMHQIIIWLVDGPESETYKKHLERNADFLWKSKEGLLMNGTNGSQLWDAAFTVQAMVESGLAEEPEFRDSLMRAHEFVDNMQIKTDPVIDWRKCYRHISKGAWPFSTRDQSYTLSDCTAEALKAVCLLQREVSFGSQVKPYIPDERLFDAVNVLLSMQNSHDGGFASYELRRGPWWLEWLNPAEVFGNIMIEYSYPECTTSVVLGLCTFKHFFPDHRKAEIDATIKTAVKYILKAQRPDGSWYGSWAICFTYAMMFALESLAACGMNYENSEEVRRACNFLISKQRDDGWGESYQSCETATYVHHRESQVVNTSWAMLALLAVDYPFKNNLRRAAQLLLRRQQPSGEWLQEGIEGVFNKNCMISYPNYKFYFTIWALGRYAKKWGDEVIVNDDAKDSKISLTGHITENHTVTAIMSQGNNNAFVTLVTSDSYLPGALTLAHGLRLHGTTIPIIVLCPPNSLSGATISTLYRAFDKVIYVPLLKSGSAAGDSANLELLGRSELDITYTKFHVFNPDVIGSYEKVVFMDADSFPLRNVDELFDFIQGDIGFAAAPDVGWPDIFNSGVFVLRPNKVIYDALVWAANTWGSFDGGDQGILNTFFSSWSGYPSSTGQEFSSQDGRPEWPNVRAGRLPFIYNVTPSAVYSYLPAFMKFRTDIAIVHFAGTVKPWQQTRLTSGGILPLGLPEGTVNLHADWWRIYDDLLNTWRVEDEARKTAGNKEIDDKVNEAQHGIAHMEISDRGRSEAPQPPPFANMMRYEWDRAELEFPHRPRSVSPVKRNPPSSGPSEAVQRPASAGPSQVIVPATQHQPPHHSAQQNPVLSPIAVQIPKPTNTVAEARKFLDEAPLSPDGDVLFTEKPGSKWNATAAHGTAAHATAVHESSGGTIHSVSGAQAVMQSPTEETMASAKVITKTTTTTTTTTIIKESMHTTFTSAAPPPENFTTSRYEWDPKEFTPRQRRLSESKVSILVSSRSGSAGSPASASSSGANVASPAVAVGVVKAAGPMVLDDLMVVPDGHEEDDILPDDEVDEEGVPLRPTARKRSESVKSEQNAGSAVAEKVVAKGASQSQGTSGAEAASVKRPKSPAKGLVSTLNAPAVGSIGVRRLSGGAASAASGLATGTM
ncbi:Lanosterol synthase (Oxidosqualene--lanosterol cyclase) [Blyttiomyces sp. JEL0837]|nr:Lanosterol synthase (Oxidosqualene--lanosterol cyclase) [Blyttiomyces sp. JEL0837]